MWFEEGIYRRVAESFSGRVRFLKFRAGLLKYYMLKKFLVMNICANNDIDHVSYKLFPAL